MTETTSRNFVFSIIDEEQEEQLLQFHLTEEEADELDIQDEEDFIRWTTDRLTEILREEDTGSNRYYAAHIALVQISRDCIDVTFAEYSTYVFAYTEVPEYVEWEEAYDESLINEQSYLDWERACAMIDYA